MSITCPGTVPTWIHLVSKLGLRGVRPATNLLRHGIVFYACTFVIISGDSHEEERMEIHKDENRRNGQLLQKTKKQILHNLTRASCYTYCA